MASPSRVLLSSVVNSSSPAVTAVSQESITVDSDTVVILAALLCALICVVGLFAVVRCAWLRRSTTTILPRIPADKGLKKKVLKSLPKFTFNGSVVVSNGKLAADCPICLAEFALGDEIRVLPQCGHGFHVGCIDTWLGSHSSCPSCRQVLIVSRCNKCGGFPATSSAGETDLEVGVIAAGGAKATSSTNENDNRFLP